MNELYTKLRPKPHFERRSLPITSSVFVSPSSHGPSRVISQLLVLGGKYVHLDRHVRLFYYFLGATLLAFVGRLFEPLPTFYLTQKRNLLNDYVVKLGLFWTTALLLPFIFFASKVYSGSNYITIFRHLTRLLVNYAFWFVITAIIIKVENSSGFCSLRGYEIRSSCIRNGGHWFAFEISGHCFLLTYCSLTIAEELLVFRDWYSIPKCISKAVSSSPNRASKHELTVLDQYHSYSSTVQALFLLCTAIMLLWDVMFLITNLYYHTWMQNITGLGFAGISWYLTYGWWYRSRFSPGMPGQSALEGERLGFKPKISVTSK